MNIFDKKKKEIKSARERETNDTRDNEKYVCVSVVYLLVDLHSRNGW